MNAPLDWPRSPARRSTLETPPGADVERLRRARLVDWLREQGATLPAMTIDEFDGERGVRSACDIAEAVEVARIPERLFITAETVRTSRIGQALLARCPEASERVLLAVFLLQTRRDGGFWAPYVDACRADSRATRSATGDCI